MAQGTRRKRKKEKEITPWSLDKVCWLAGYYSGRPGYWVFVIVAFQMTVYLFSLIYIRADVGKSIAKWSQD